MEEMFLKRGLQCRGSSGRRARLDLREIRRRVGETLIAGLVEILVEDGIEEIQGLLHLFVVVFLADLLDLREERTFPLQGIMLMHRARLGKRQINRKRERERAISFPLFARRLDPERRPLSLIRICTIDTLLSFSLRFTSCCPRERLTSAMGESLLVECLTYAVLRDAIQTRVC